jgi:hypothetical protein
MEFKLFYNCRNGGDGSVSVDFFPNKKLADKAESESELEEGWGESSVGDVILKIEDGKILFQEMVWDEKNSKFNYIWHELKGK